MKNKPEKMQKKIDKAQKRLNLYIDNDEDYNKICKKCVYIHKIIEKYLDLEMNLKNERRYLMTKYDNLIEVPFKNEIIGQIRSEVRKKYPAMGIKELLHFSTNVYISATLVAHNIPEQEIVDQLMILNNKFFNITQNENDIIINRELEPPTLEYLTYITDKYIKIIKERI